jgi:putative endonuclease
MKKDSKDPGKLGEDLASVMLAEKGYKIIKRNFRFSHGEIDIVAKDGDTLVFVEVKTRRSDEYGTPESALTPAKQKQIIKIAKAYLYINDISDIQCRFDVIGIIMPYNSAPQINHIENAFIEM